MTNEEKNFLLIDLCARLPYGVIVLEDIDKTFDGGCVSELVTITEIKGEKMFLTKNSLTPVTIEEIRPYLRPMSSMTEEERKQLEHIFNDEDWPCLVDEDGCVNFARGNDFICPEVFEIYFDFLNANHIDYRGLIKKGLALPATQDMY